MKFQINLRQEFYCLADPCNVANNQYLCTWRQALDTNEFECLPSVDCSQIQTCSDNRYQIHCEYNTCSLNKNCRWESSLNGSNRCVEIPSQPVFNPDEYQYQQPYTEKTITDEELAKWNLDITTPVRAFRSETGELIWN